MKEIKDYECILLLREDLDSTELVISMIKDTCACLTKPQAVTLRDELTKFIGDKVEANLNEAARQVFDSLLLCGFFDTQNSFGWMLTPTPRTIACAGKILGKKEEVTGLGLLMREPCDKESSRGKPVLGIAIVNGKIEILSFPAGECPWLIHEEPTPRWPEAYWEYGAFGYKNRTYVHEDLKMYMKEEGWLGHPYTATGKFAAPKRYVNYGGRTFSTFIRCLPKFTKIKNFDLPSD